MHAFLELRADSMGAVVHRTEPFLEKSIGPFGTALSTPGM